MKNISKWLMAGTVFTVAFGCQCQTNASEESKENPSQNKQKGGECSERAKAETAAPVSPSASAAAKVAPAPLPVAEKKAAPISAPAIRVVEQGGVPAVKENPIASPALRESSPATSADPLSSVGPAAAPAPEVKAEVTTKSPAPVNQVGNVTENQSASN